jgi:hypothetical protein
VYGSWVLLLNTIAVLAVTYFLVVQAAMTQETQGLTDQTEDSNRKRCTEDNV